MDFVKIFQFFIETYGYSGFVVSVLIIILFITLPYLIKKNNKDIKDGLKDITVELTQAIKNENKELIAGLQENQTKLIDNQLELVKNLLINQKLEHDKHLDTRDTISTPIQNKINHLRDFYNCSRVSVMEFHNSLVNLNGLPFKWYDLIYESIARGVHSVSMDTKNMPFNILSPIIKEIQDGDIAIFDKSGIEKFYNQSSVLYDICINKNHITGLIVAPLLNRDNQLVGILTLEYSFDNSLDVQNIDISELELESHSISTLLELE